MNFGTLFLIVIAGCLGPLLSGFRRLSVPLGLGEICAGILLGVSGFRLIDPSEPTLQFFASVGFAMLMFLIGTKLPLREPNLRSVLKHSVISTVVAFGVAFPLALLLAHVTAVHNTAIFLLLLSCSSTAVVMPMMHERGLSGRTVLLTTTLVAVADITTVVALPLAMYPGKLIAIGIGAVVVTFVAILCLQALKLFRNSDRGDHLRKLSKERGWALDLRMSIGILFGLTWLATQFGTSVLVAGFAAGAVVATISQPRRFTKQLVGLAEGFFVPLFFVELGAKLDFRAMLHSPHFLILTACIVVGSIVVHLIVAKAVNLPYSSGLIAASQQGLPIALVSIGLGNGMLQAGQGAAIIAAAMVLLGVTSIGVH
ncbi:MAG: cation:proton antiporter, partial [bacterium]